MASSPQDSKTTEINAIGWTGVVLAAVFTASRLFTRLRLTKNAGFDDAIIVFSLVSLDFAFPTLQTPGRLRLMIIL